MPECNQAVIVEICGKKYNACIILASENRKSLYLQFDAVVSLLSGACTAGMAVSGNPATGEYVDVVSNTLIRIERIQ